RKRSGLEGSRDQDPMCISYTEKGLSSALCCCLSRIHASSDHWNHVVPTIEAVCGGCSFTNANGSAFSRCSPVFEWIWYLYTSPNSNPSINPSPMPLLSHRTYTESLYGFHPLKLPPTETDAALGAQTAK